MTKSKKRNTNKGKKKDVFKTELTGIFLIGIAVYILWIFWSVPESGYPLLTDKFGLFGRFIRNSISTFVGGGKYLVSFLLLGLGIYMVAKKAKPDPVQTRIISLWILCILILMHLKLPLEDQSILAGWNGEGGGIIGGILCVLLTMVFGTIGTYILIFFLLLLSFLYLTKISITDVMEISLEWIKGKFAAMKNSLEDFIFVDIDDDGKPLKKTKEKKKSLKSSLPKPLNISVKKEEKEKQQPFIINNFNDFLPTAVEEKEDNAVQEDSVKGKMDGDKQLNPLDEKKKEIIDSTEEEFTPTNSLPDAYIAPSLDLLTSPVKQQNGISQNDINEKVELLQSTLNNFGVKGNISAVSCGPAITRYEFQPAPGVKVSRIVNLSDDIALSLAAAGVRIEAPIPGKAAVGIEVPNKEVAMVTLREVLDSEIYKHNKSKLTVALGKDISGQPIIADLAKMPHLLIAGATGAGKSVCMNSLITSILFKAKPTEVKFLMVDPKMVELSIYNGIPHLISPVVTDPKKAAGALRWAVQEMERRYELFATHGAKDIGRYNQMALSDTTAEKKEFLPYIVVLIDELADLMMVAPADVEDAICRLAQMARAAGIHLVVATQRPSVDVITGIIKANIPSRIAFAVSSQIDSRTILDTNGAEKLLGRGDMLFYPTGYPKPVRVQGVYVDDHDVENVVEFLKEQGMPTYLEEISEQKLSIDESKHDLDEDPLIGDAAKLFIENGQASISLLQRRFRIGYNRAARIIDQMEQKGIIGPYEGSKPRQVKISVAQYEETYGQLRP